MVRSKDLMNWTGQEVVLDEHVYYGAADTCIGVAAVEKEKVKF
ncbi:hypothetical protein [Thermosediminibacter oceani]|uniref:Uncharacterized protein n=1 Tax=Thermosediminibacter oceani (strain ATCC BAA-1034 / DSM 16646 / JW/IW-1228P) TaxID=555079 RepID=D9S081_THEOJ|nr:hypothetical protein [Thermosediminibacter oceani]ADL07009.1 hypothetical protein Toce_0222 [Thermosediminibacter oceani DSM 16646]